MVRLLKHQILWQGQMEIHGIKLTIILAETTEANPITNPTDKSIHWLLLQRFVRPPEANGHGINHYILKILALKSRSPKTKNDDFSY